jgi:hypothetical protein
MPVPVSGVIFGHFVLLKCPNVRPDTSFSVLRAAQAELLQRP